MKFPIALQPFTIREEMSQDYVGSLEKVAAIGYTGIELGLPPEGMTVAEQKELLTRLGLQVIGTHCSLEQLTNDLDSITDYLHEVGGKYVALSHHFDSREAVLEAAQAFNRIGENCAKQGVTFLYHNHNWEFTQFDGEYALDILLRETDPSFVKMELDTYWVKRAGLDPAAYLRKLQDRCPLLHIKDMEPGEEQFFAEVGEGILNFADIFQAAEKVGTEWLVVEQDQSRRSPLESIAISYNNLKKMGAIKE
ncbi:sugar phosphate isomerase [Paenibacillus baekrokdamisoli]|uniref:Sugar phosphate isomerase n=1 Tax=Paenibacillus baekrokdamisoli TaxID=1712516 RepID=A0A3G9JBB9_9BACL|nr:sugar phosphate isomerase/epimerase [Paenibacillus baekrokdamisoli]MBB3071996.1 sugar phosphate isomerase/epimerase [Paenibacillus baekrokdamisoli]BBH20299.1 sugar phosphate isomerase [Paenibacillus baekrokdamisoli]